MRHKHSLSNGQIQILDEILGNGIKEANLSAEIINDLLGLEYIGLVLRQANTDGFEWLITQAGIAFIYAYHTITGK